MAAILASFPGLAGCGLHWQHGCSRDECISFAGGTGASNSCAWPQMAIVTRSCDVLAYASSMRRLLAIFVLALNAWGLLAPFALAASADSTPACCRRNGKHHCMSGMSATAVSSEGVPILRSQFSKCPYGSETARPGFVARIAISATSTVHSPSEFFVAPTKSAQVSSHPAGSISPRGPPA